MKRHHARKKAHKRSKVTGRFLKGGAMGKRRHGRRSRRGGGIFGDILGKVVGTASSLLPIPFIGKLAGSAAAAGLKKIPF